MLSLMFHLFLLYSLAFFPIGISAQYYGDTASCFANDTSCNIESYTTGEYQKRAEIIETINTQYGEPQVILNIYTEETRQNLEQTSRYITTHETWKYTCQNHHHLCSYWAATHECSNNPAYMQVSLLLLLEEKRRTSVLANWIFAEDILRS